MFWIELAIVLAIIFLGVRKGGYIPCICWRHWNVNHDFCITCETI